MRIDEIELYYVAMPLKYPWRTAYGEDWEIHSVLVKAVGDGHEGWGETTSFFAPTYSPETAGSAFFLLKEVFCPLLVGQEIESAHDLNQRLAMFKGNPFAKAGIELAWWSLEAQIKGRPLHQLLGGTRQVVEAGADFGVQDSFDMLLGNIEKALQAGFKRVKLKAKPGWDLDMLKAVRSTFPKDTFHIDCNSGYTLDDLPFFKAVDKMGLAMIEQPLQHNDLVDHAELQRQIETPVCLDESLTSVRDMEMALRLGSCRYVNIKPGRVGGLANARAIHDLAEQNGIPAWVGGMLESGIGAGICVELASLSDFVYPNDLFPSERFYEQDMTEPALKLEPGCVFKVSDVPGTPYRPVQERIDRVTKQKAMIRKNRS